MTDALTQPVADAPPSPLAALLQAAIDVRRYVQQASRLDISGLAEKRLKALDAAIKAAQPHTEYGRT